MLIVSDDENNLSVGDVEGVDGVFDVDCETAHHLLNFAGWRRPTVEEADAYRNGSLSVEEVPSGNASREVWATYALAVGRSQKSIEGLTRDGIRNSFK